MDNILVSKFHIGLDESEIYGRHYEKFVIYLEKTLRIYYNH